jgi:hypothetical protein
MIRKLLVSIGVHVAAFSFFWFASLRLSQTAQNSHQTILVEIDHATRKPINPVMSHGQTHSAIHAMSGTHAGGFNLGNLGLVRHDSIQGSAQGPYQNPGSELLNVDGKELQAFDQLAVLVNGHLDYPTMLAENGVHGLASLDLFFDHEAKIDENRSHFYGDNRLVRGLLVKATRKALEDWFHGCGGKLAREQFRDQHFQADFIITFTSTQSSELQKEQEGSYHLYRRSLVQTCLNPMAGGLDLTCVALRVAGVISNNVSSTYKMKYQALKDQLEAFDEMDFKGLREVI